MVVGFHSHSGQFCLHAHGTLEEMVQAAIGKGFKIYGLSEHIPRYRAQDLYPEEEISGLEPPALMTMFENYLAEAHRLKQKYASQINLIVGLESEYITRLDLENLLKLLDKHADKIQYIVGSVHHVSTIPIDFDPATFSRALGENTSSLPVLVDNYLDRQKTLIDTLQPDVIGHFDLCYLYYPYFDVNQYPNICQKIKRNVQTVVDYGGLFEINTSALRKGWSTPYPAPSVASIILECGGRFTLSDDSHAPDKVGFGYDKIVEYLKKMNINQLYYLKERSEQTMDEDTPSSATTIRKRQVQVVPFEPEWINHSIFTPLPPTPATPDTPVTPATIDSSSS